MNFKNILIMHRNVTKILQVLIVKKTEKRKKLQKFKLKMKQENNKDKFTNNKINYDKEYNKNQFKVRKKFIVNKIKEKQMSLIQ